MLLPRFTTLTSYNPHATRLELMTFDEIITRTPADILDQFVGRNEPSALKFNSTKAEINIAVSSSNQIKIEAARLGTLQYFPNAKLAITGFPAKSGINEQPIGFEESFRGAVNRLIHTKTQISALGSNNFDYAIAFENGIIHFVDANGESYFDVSCVVVEHLATGAQVFMVSGGIEFPHEDVITTKSLPGGFRTNTVGSVIAKRIGCSPNDPQHYLLQGLLRRQDILAQATYFALVDL